MKYALVKVVNGNFSVNSEHGEDLQAAKVAFHGEAKTLWNSKDVISAEIKIVDEQLDCVDGYKEFIFHAAEA